MSGFHLIITTPEGNVFDDCIEGVFLRGCNGDMAVLPGHIPFATSVQAGMCGLQMRDGTKKKGEITEGILSVSQESVILLVRSCRLQT